MKIKHTVAALTLAAFGLSAQVAHAAPMSGFSDVTKVGDIYTFTFDTLPGPDIDGNAEGLSFTSDDALLSLIATGSDTVRQDVPSNGGLGILGGGSDNIEGTEYIRLAFSMAVDLVDFSLNGEIGANGHQATANGRVSYGTNSAATYNDYFAQASNWDGEGSDTCPPCNFVSDFEGFTTFGLGGGTGDLFEGYIESISVRISAVPEPSIIALFAAGLIGVGFARRRKA